MKNLHGRYLTPAVALALGIATFLLASLYYSHGVAVYGPDSENILAPMFYDISRAIHRYGLLAGMYDPGQIAGLSLWDVPYFHALYPFYFNWLGGDANIFDTLARLRLVNFLHLAIYGVGCYLLSRGIGVRQWLAIAIGLVSPWLPAVHSTSNWPQILASLAWVPWVLACQVWLYRDGDKWQRWLATLGLALTFSLLTYAQPAQNMVLVVIGSAIVWACIAISTWKGGQRDERRAFVGSTVALGAAGALAALICGKYLFSVVIYLSKAIRWLGNDGAIIGSQRVPLGAMREYALKLSDAGALLAYSSKHTVIVGNIYVGVAVAVFAVLGFFASGKDRRLVGALLVSAVVTMLFCFGFFTPLLRLIPVANKVREVNWWSCYTVTVLMPLGGYGLQRLLELDVSDGAGKRFKKAALCVLLAAGVVTLVLIPFMDADLVLPAVLSLCVSFALLVACMLFPAGTRRFHQPAAIMVLLLGVVAPMLAYVRDMPRQSMLMFKEQIDTRSEAQRIAMSITDAENFRFAVSTDIPYYKNLTVTLANLDLRGIRGDISPQEYDKFRLLFFPTPAVANLYGVKYQVVPRQPIRNDDIRIDDKISLRVNPQALPRLFFVQGGIQVVKSPVDALLATPDDGVVRIFAAQEDLPSGIDLSQRESGEPTQTVAHMLDNGAVQLRAQLDTKGSGVLVLNEDIAGRWRATIDGQPVAPFRVNGYQTAFHLEGGGTHTVEISRPGRLL